MKQEENIKKRIGALLRKGNTLSRSMSSLGLGFNYGEYPDDIYHDTTMEIYMGTLGLLESLYGKTSNQVAELKQENKRIMSLKYRQSTMDRMLLQGLLGFLSNLKMEVAQGLVNSIYWQASNEILTDFLMLAKQSRLDGNKNVSAVLACAALEDGLKKLAETNGLRVSGNGMLNTLNALKSNGTIRKDQYELLKSYVSLRNKAFHADWESFDDADVGGVIGFTEVFLAQHIK